jgi:hypothetical protein
MGYRKRGPKPKPLVVQVNTLSWSQDPSTSPSLNIASQITYSSPGEHPNCTRTSGPTPYDATSTRGSWSIPDVPGLP